MPAMRPGRTAATVAEDRRSSTRAPAACGWLRVVGAVQAGRRGLTISTVESGATPGCVGGRRVRAGVARGRAATLPPAAPGVRTRQTVNPSTTATVRRRCISWAAARAPEAVAARAARAVTHSMRSTAVGAAARARRCTTPRTRSVRPSRFRALRTPTATSRSSNCPQLRTLAVRQPPASSPPGVGSLTLTARVTGNDARSHRSATFSIMVACRAGGHDIRLASRAAADLRADGRPLADD